MNNKNSKLQKIKQFFSKKQEPESFVYATDWLKSTEHLKTYDEVLLSLMDYYSYIDTQKAKVQTYFAQKQNSPLYTNFKIEHNKKTTLNQMEGQKYDAYVYSKHYSKALSQIKEQGKVTIIKEQAKQASFDAKK